MQDAIAQAVALTTHGNAALAPMTIFHSADFYPSNSTFKFCESVKFVDRRLRSEKWASVPYEDNPVAWIERLKRDDACGLRLSYEPSNEKRISERMLVGLVGGGGRWLIEAAGQTQSDYWEGRWEIGDKGRADKRIWRVTYWRIARSRPRSQNVYGELDDTREKLRETLTQIAGFARSQNLDSFAKAFDSGLSRLTSDEPYQDLFHRDIVPPHFLPLKANQLLGTAQAAWVFGGMGSWNDQGFAGANQKRYEELSEELYQLLIKAILAAANSRFESAPGSAE